MSRALHHAAMAAGAVVLVAAFSQAPRGLRRMDAFRIRRVEVTGTRFLDPENVLEASGITAKSNLFDDPNDWREALMRHPLVARVDVERHPPGTVVLDIVETEPVALARGPVLQPVDARGRVLPIDPALAPLDLPVLDGVGRDSAGSRLSGSEARAVLDALVRIRRLQPELMRRTSEVGLGRDGSVELRLRDPADAVVLLPAEADAQRLRELMSTLADLRRRQELERLRRLDGRFRGQVVVSLNPTAG